MGGKAKGDGGKIPGARRRGSHSRAIAKKKEKREKDSATTTADWCICQVCSWTSNWDVC